MAPPYFKNCKDSRITDDFGCKRNGGDHEAQVNWCGGDRVDMHVINGCGVDRNGVGEYGTGECTTDGVGCYVTGVKIGGVSWGRVNGCGVS